MRIIAEPDIMVYRLYNRSAGWCGRYMNHVLGNSEPASKLRLRSEASNPPRARELRAGAGGGFRTNTSAGWTPQTWGDRTSSRAREFGAGAGGGWSLRLALDPKPLARKGSRVPSRARAADHAAPRRGAAAGDRPPPTRSLRQI